ncbi:MAG: toll/interleukin-1 receptor domain-containing protein [Egibacteraceae bacterium]
MGQEGCYAAFISYSHADGRLAPAVERGLQRLAKPWHRRRALHIFRDDCGLAVTPALWSSIADELDRSDYFILLASPEAAQSEWVDREIERWKETKPLARILPVLTDGELRWDPRRGDFDPDRSTALPRALLGVFSEEPRYLDLRWARSETELDLRHSRFRDAIAQLAAPLHGLPKDDLESEDIRLHRRAMRTAWSAVAILVVLLLAASTTGVVAVTNARRADQQARVADDQAQRADDQAQRAEQQAQRANEEARIAQARELAALASARRNEHPLSLLLGLESLRTAPTNEAFLVLLQALQEPQLSNVLSLGHADDVEDVAFSPDGTTLITAANDDIARRWDVATGDEIGETTIGPPPRTWSRFGPTGTPVVALRTLSPDGKRIVTLSTDRFLRLQETATGHTIGSYAPVDFQLFIHVALSSDGTTIAFAEHEQPVRLVDGLTGQPIGKPLTGHTASSSGGIGLITEIAFSPDGTTLATAGLDSTVRLWDARTGRPLGAPLRGHTGHVIEVVFSPDSTTVASGGEDQAIRLWDVRSRQPIGQPLSGHTASVTELAFSPDGKTIASGGLDQTVRLWNIATGQLVGSPLTVSTRSVNRLAFSPDGARLAGIDGPTVRLWNVQLRPSIGLPLTGHTGGTDAVAFSPDNRAILSSDGATIRLWDVESGQPIGQPLASPTDYMSAVAFSPDGKTIAAAGDDYAIRLLDAATGQPIGMPLTATPRGSKRSCSARTARSSPRAASMTR